MQKISNKKKVKIVFKCVLAYLVDFDLNLVQVQIYYFEVSYTTDVKLHKFGTYFSCILLSIHDIDKVFKLKVVDIKEFYILCSMHLCSV
jgi:hypothetical protein